MCRGDFMCRGTLCAAKSLHIKSPQISSWKTVQNVYFCNEKYSRTFALDILTTNTAIRHRFRNKNRGNFMCRGDLMCMGDLMCRGDFMCNDRRTYVQLNNNMLLP